MITPAQYRHQLSGLDFTILDKPLAGKAEAAAALPGIIALQNHLQQIEQGINMEMHVIHNQYQAKLSAAEAGSSGRIMVSAKRRVGSSQRANEEAHLTAERDEKINPYQEIKKATADLLARVEAVRSTAEKLAG